MINPLNCEATDTTRNGRSRQCNSHLLNSRKISPETSTAQIIFNQINNPASDPSKIIHKSETSCVIADDKSRKKYRQTIVPLESMLVHRAVNDQRKSLKIANIDKPRQVVTSSTALATPKTYYRYNKTAQQRKPRGSNLVNK